MLKYLFVALFLLHGLIHLLGFLKAFQLSEIEQLTLPISRPVGVLWLVAALLFLITAGLYLTGAGYWPIPALVAVVLSQVLIIMAWQDAKFGTIANIIILVVAVAGYGAWSFENSYRKDVREALTRTNAMETELLTEADLQHLPAPVQRYLRYVGVVGKPKVKNFRVTFTGEMRDREQDWFPFTAEQYNFIGEPERLFFMKAKVKGLPTDGYHCYQDGNAGMLIKVLSLFPVVNIQGKDLLKAETVTFFNDMCIMAPAALIDDRIQWEPIDDRSAKATFTTWGVSISATLFFNEKGQFVDFLSHDRTDISAMEQYPFSTPVGNYGEVNGYNLCTYGEAVWHYPEGKFAYGKFNIQAVEYNVEGDAAIAD